MVPCPRVKNIKIPRCFLCTSTSPVHMFHMLRKHSVEVDPLLVGFTSPLFVRIARQINGEFLLEEPGNSFFLREVEDSSNSTSGEVTRSISPSHASTGSTPSTAEDTATGCLQNVRSEKERK